MIFKILAYLVVFALLAAAIFAGIAAYRGIERAGDTEFSDDDRDTTKRNVIIDAVVAFVFILLAFGFAGLSDI